MNPWATTDSSLRSAIVVNGAPQIKIKIKIKIKSKSKSTAA
ncbi:hypothetical protein [Pseudomonas antarctica]|nr:hypothetical protein [Pseudomonas antarctica]